MIDHTDVDVKAPTLTLENLDPSPLLHMKLQSEVITKLAARFGAPKNVTSAADVIVYKGMIQEWMHSFPAVYDFDKPDFSKDGKYSWVTSHRFYIHTMAYLMILNPIRTFMSKSLDRSSPPDELQVRADGIYYALRNLNTTTEWTKYSSHRDGRYHFIIFSLFDTASVLCAALLKDSDRSIPRREEILAAIENAVAVLRRINNLSKTAKTSYDILSRMVRRLPRSKQGANRKRARMTETKYIPDQSVVSNRGYVPIDEANQFHGSSSASASTSPSTFASSVTGSSPHSYLGGEVYACSTPDSAALSIDGRTMASSLASINQMQFDSSMIPGSIDNMIHSAVPGMMPGPGPVPSHDPMAPHMHPMYTELQPPMGDMAPGFGFEPITDAELGEFNRLWDWQSLDLDFITSEAVAPGHMA